jgi:hypothetical protein
MTSSCAKLMSFAGSPEAPSNARLMTPIGWDQIFSAVTDGSVYQTASTTQRTEAKILFVVRGACTHLLRGCRCPRVPVHAPHSAPQSTAASPCSLCTPFCGVRGSTVLSAERELHIEFAQLASRNEWKGGRALAAPRAAKRERCQRRQLFCRFWVRSSARLRFLQGLWQRPHSARRGASCRPPLTVAHQRC